VRSFKLHTSHFELLTIFSLVLVNLVPEFLGLLDAPDPVAAYRTYHAAHHAVLSSYWHNYLLDPESPPAVAVVERAMHAGRGDLRALLASVDIVTRVEDALARAHDLLQVDRPVDCYLMVGMGGANAGELVIGGRGTIFICLEHFTGQANPETFGMGLSPDLIPLWVGHEVAHTVRYTSPGSASEIKRLVQDQGGAYDCWEAGSRVPLRELLLNEGLAVHAAEAVAPGQNRADYFGYPKRQYHRMRELESFLRRTAEPELDQSGLGLRLRYLSGGVSRSARTVGGKILPERCGYYLGHRMAEPLVRERGIAQALRAEPREFQEAESYARGFRTA